MLNIFKNIKKKTEERVQKYAQKNIDELLRITNRPREGEIVKINNIKIRKDFKRPNWRKIERRREYYNKNKYFKREIILDKNNYLQDGYTTYLLAKQMRFDFITIKRK